MSKNSDSLTGLLVFAPLVMGVSSFWFGIKLGLLAFVLIVLLASILFLFRKLSLPSQQQLVLVLIVGISLLSVTKMLLEAEAYAFVEKVGVFLPLLLINSLVLSVSQSLLTMSDYKSAIGLVIKIALASLLFFAVFGLLNTISFINTPAGFLFLSAFLLATINFLNKKNTTSDRVSNIE